MDKENVVYMHNGIVSVIKKNEIMSSTGKWMELENLMFSEIRQT
jgi:hypothetical protein